jgi:hypothetical protein
MNERLIQQLRAENEALRKRIAELEHTLEVQEWGTQLFHESEIPQLLLDLDTGAILAANAAARNYYGDALIGRGDIMCVCAGGLDWETRPPSARGSKSLWEAPLAPAHRVGRGADGRNAFRARLRSEGAQWFTCSASMSQTVCAPKKHWN